MVRGLEQTNRVSIEYPMITERSGMNVWIQWWNYCVIWTRPARMEGTSMNEIKSIKQYSKLISIELSGMDDNTDHQVAWHFEDLEYLNTINIQYSEILSNVTERDSWKLYPPELIMDVRLGRSTQQIISNHFIITSHCQWTRIIIISSIKCTPTECNGL